MSLDTLTQMTKLAVHPSITHFELRPKDRYGVHWYLSYRDINTEAPAYSGRVEGSIPQCLTAALVRADQIKATRTTRKMKRIT